MAAELDRHRSFIERYVIERATHFEIGREQEQAWMAIQDGKKIYGMIAETRNTTDIKDDGGQLAGVSQAPNPYPTYPPATPAAVPQRTTSVMPPPTTARDAAKKPGGFAPIPRLGRWKNWF